MKESNKSEELYLDNTPNAHIMEPEEDDKYEENTPHQSSFCKNNITESNDSSTEKNLCSQKFDEETITLTDQKTKKRLSKILIKINDNIVKVGNEKKNLENIYKEHLNLKGFISQKYLKEGLKSRDNCLGFIFIAIYPIITIINLIGIFQMISIMKILKMHLINSIKYFLPLLKCKDYEFFSFFNFYYKELLNEQIDYNLMMLFGFLGNLSLGTVGFRASSFIFAAISTAGFFMIYNFNFDGYNEKTNKYQFFCQTLYIIIMYAFLSVGVGGSALLSQQILLDYFYKYQERNNDINNEHEQNENKNNNGNIKNQQNKNDKTNRDLNFFFIICFTTIVGYYLKYLLNIGLATILGEHNQKRSFFFYCYFIYLVPIFISIIIYWITDVYTFEKINDKRGKDNNGKKNPTKVCKLFGFLFYYEKNIKERLDDRFRCECCKLCCNTIDTCFNETICTVIRCQDENDGKKYCCFKYCYICKPYCEKEVDEKYYDELDNVLFCYCYQEARIYKWFYNFMNNKGQIELTKIMFNYCILQLNTIALEKIYYENQEVIKKQDNNVEILLDFKRLLISSGIYVLIIVVFFYITISWGRYAKDSQKEIEQEREELQKKIQKQNGQYIKEDIKKKEKLNEREKLLNEQSQAQNGNKIESLSNDIFTGSIVILGFNSLFSFIFTIFYYSNNSASKALINDPNNYYNYILYIPLLMNKFYYFTFIYYCIKVTEVIKGFDLMSGSTLISIYLLVWSSFFGILIDLIPIKFIFILFAVQIISSTLILFKFFLIIINNLFCRGMFFRTSLYLLFYIFACGGIWFFGCCDCCKCCKCCECFETKGNFNDKCCKHCNYNYCEHEECSEILDNLIEFKCCKKDKNNIA